MARRIHFDQGTSRLAIWARRIAVFALLAAVLSIVIVHAGILDIWPALATFGAALALAALAMLLALASFVPIWKDGVLGLGAAMTAIVMAMLLLAYPSYMAFKARSLPWLYDITTDPIDPPRYEALAKVRPRNANPIIYAGLAAAEQQLAAYPDIEPIDGDIEPLAAYKAALTVVTRRRWPIVDARAPDQGRLEGRIEAVARTPVMGFRDDVIVRVRPFEGGARIDLRSSSRYGRFDFGANAARVRLLIEDIEAELARDVPDEPPIARPKAPKSKVQPKTPAKPPPKSNQPSAKR